MILDAASIAAIGSAVAAAISAFSALRSPSRERDSRKRDLKLKLFQTVMQERATIYSEESVRALNLVDVIYVNDIQVRDAWSDLFNLFATPDPNGPHKQLLDEKLHILLREMAEVLRMSPRLKTVDFTRTYFPTSIAKRREMEALQVDLELARLRAQIGMAANERDILHKFPPKPL